MSRQDEGIQPREIDWRKLVKAKRLMRRGFDLDETAHALQVRRRDLDFTLWNHFGEDAFDG